ncbi:MAG: aminomethyl-transferring glycine dehydrogenase subunit GcvPA [Candidatus Aminicenantia bacterium]
MKNPYFPSSENDVKSMLSEIGVSSEEEFFLTIPEEFKIKRSLQLPQPMDEISLLNYFKELSSKNRVELIPFIGAGAYPHYIPTVVDFLSSRGEFLTPYTPYQPELSQGTLQIIFEYQTLICSLTGMEVSNASLYDGATATAESALMAWRIKKGDKILVSSTIHPLWRETLKTYLKNFSIEITEIPYRDDGKTDYQKALELCDDRVFAIIVQTPNFFGIVEDLKEVSDIAKEKKILFLVGVSEALSLGLLKPPGEFGADIAFGEVQSFGLPLSFGGPYLGFIASKMEFVRQMPGRIAGETVDKNGKRGFVLTLSTREQHIRREKATSNICTNQAWCALRATIYLETLGRKGLMELAKINFLKASYGKRKIEKMKGIKLKFNSLTFNEFVVEFEKPIDKIYEKMEKEGFIPGFPVSKFYKELKNASLLCFTEVHSRETIDRFIEKLGEML